GALLRPRFAEVRSLRSPPVPRRIRRLDRRQSKAQHRLRRRWYGRCPQGIGQRQTREQLTETTMSQGEDGMAIDLAGGMSPSKDFFLAEKPEDPQFRESASFWISDDKGLDRKSTRLNS